MNKITLRGVFTNVKPSHKIKDIEYDQANLLVPRKDGKEDIVSLKFKKFSNKYNENTEIELTGNIRSYSRKLDNGKNKVSLYVFTYFDVPEDDTVNNVKIDGRICKIEPVRKTVNGKTNIHFILANNLVTDSEQKLNSYIPCIAWGKLAKELSLLSVNTLLEIEGELHSREYKKKINEEEFEIRVAHELVVTSFEVK